MKQDFADLHTWVADEVAALANRLVDARSTDNARRLDEARNAFAAAAADIQAALTQPPIADDEIRLVKEQLASHAGLEALRLRLEEQDQTTLRLREELTSANAEVKAARAELGTARTDLATAHGDLATAHTELASARAKLTTVQADLTTAKTDITTARAELTAERERTAQARGEIARMAAEFQTSSNAGLDELRSQLQDHDTMNLRLRTELTNAQADLDTARTDLSTERERTAHAQGEILRMTEEFESTLDELRREQATVVGEQALAYSSLPLDAMLSMFNALRRCTTLPDVLSALVNGIAREFTRVALFDVRGSHLEGSQQVGFDFENDISKVVIPLVPESFLGRAVSSGRLETFFPSINTDISSTIPFGGSPACALAIPIVVQGVSVAIIYADDSDNTEFAGATAQMRAKFAEILQQHALLVLLRVGLHQKAVVELREFVGLLVDELEYTHTGDVEAGKNALERQQGLRENLERSRRIYNQRVAREGHTTTGLLEEHLWSVMEGRGDSPFGRDLAVVLGSMGASPRGSVLTMRR